MLSRYTDINIADLPKKVLPAFFGLLPDNDPAFDDWDTWQDWDNYPQHVLVCARHYSRLRNRHGAEMAYRYWRGELLGYVKDYWF